MDTSLVKQNKINNLNLLFGFGILINVKEGLWLLVTLEASVCYMSIIVELGEIKFC